jgi:predicted transcriptional regulator
MNNQEIATAQHYTKNRSKLDIIAAILNVVNAREASKTRIMYGAYLSYEQIRGYMPTLLECGLLTTTNDGQSLYKIRERGLRFLELYGKLNEMIGRKKRVGFVNEELRISL